jgi:hypothetical protein
VYLKYIPTPLLQRSPIFRYHSRLLQDTQTRSAIVSQEHFIKLKKIMLRIKVKMLRDLFLKKLRRHHNFREFQDKKTIEVEHFC